METDIRSDLPIEEKSIDPKSVSNNIDEKSVVVKDVGISKNDVSSLSPITPDSDKETGDFSIDLKSPLTLVSSPPRESVACLDSDPRTPLGSVFDPFAPSTDKLLLNAPRCRKSRAESQVNVVRRLNFDLSDDCSPDENCKAIAEAAVASDEEILLENMYDTLLEAIVSKQREGIVDVYSEDGFKTPESAERLSGVAETCPGAPTLKCGGKSRKIDQSLCRRLEF